jgi:hypothetical protein
MGSMPGATFLLALPALAIEHRERLGGYFVADGAASASS